jgi:hypothetical protein
LSSVNIKIVKYRSLQFFSIDHFIAFASNPVCDFVDVGIERPKTNFCWKKIVD